VISVNLFNPITLKNKGLFFNQNYQKTYFKIQRIFDAFFYFMLYLPRFVSNKNIDALNYL
jgi:hypothetical protein